jgi:hypothetical protein
VCRVRVSGHDLNHYSPFLLFILLFLFFIFMRVVPIKPICGAASKHASTVDHELCITMNDNMVKCQCSRCTSHPNRSNYLSFGYICEQVSFEQHSYMSVF